MKKIWICNSKKALAQCKKWLAEKLKNAELIEVNSTSYAAKIASENPGSAAISSKLKALLSNP